MTQLIPNLGAEEGPGWRGVMSEPAVRAQRRLWRQLFAPEAQLLDDDEPADVHFEGAAFPWLGGDGAVAWIATDEAASAARHAGATLTGASPEVVRAVHDKAFALATARAEGLVPPVLRGCLDVLEPELLRGPGAADAVEARVAAWPAWARARFTLKPRFGTSGRGRVAGRDGRLERARLGGGLERLAECGGAVLEPWLQRTADFSTQLYLAGGAGGAGGAGEAGVAGAVGGAAGAGGVGGVTLLGSLEQIVSPAGVFLGHRGELDSRGRVFSGHAADERLREAAALVGVAARERGYVGPCGVDAFELLGPEDDGVVLRPVVELNARFTAGTVTVGLVRRVLPRLKSELGLAPGERLRFRFWLALADDARRAARERARRPGALLLDLDAGESAPALLFERIER